MKNPVGVQVAAWLLLLVGSPVPLRSQQADLGTKIYADSSKSVFLLQVRSDSGDVVAGGKIVTNAGVYSALSVCVRSQNHRFIDQNKQLPSIPHLISATGL